MNFKRQLLDAVAIRRAITRLAHEIVEKNKGPEVILVGIRRRGVPLAVRLSELIKGIEGKRPPVVELDITPFRDDRGNDLFSKIYSPDLNIEITGKTVVLVDDVLYTGRSVRAAMDGLIVSGRPKMIQLAVLIDRGHRELPIRPDYVGKNIPTNHREDIAVKLKEVDEEDQVLLFESE